MILPCSEKLCLLLWMMREATGSPDNGGRNRLSSPFSFSSTNRLRRLGSLSTLGDIFEPPQVSQSLTQVETKSLRKDEDDRKAEVRDIFDIQVISQPQQSVISSPSPEDEDENKFNDDGVGRHFEEQTEKLPASTLDLGNREYSLMMRHTDTPVPREVAAEAGPPVAFPVSSPSLSPSPSSLSEIMPTLSFKPSLPPSVTPLPSVSFSPTMLPSVSPEPSMTPVPTSPTSLPTRMSENGLISTLSSMPSMMPATDSPSFAPTPSMTTTSPTFMPTAVAENEIPTAFPTNEEVNQIPSPVSSPSSSLSLPSSSFPPSMHPSTTPGPTTSFSPSMSPTTSPMPSMTPVPTSPTSLPTTIADNETPSPGNLTCSTEDGFFGNSTGSETFVMRYNYELEQSAEADTDTLFGLIEQHVSDVVTNELFPECVGPPSNNSVPTGTTSPAPAETGSVPMPVASNPPVEPNSPVVLPTSVAVPASPTAPIIPTTEPNSPVVLPSSAAVPTSPTESAGLAVSTSPVASTVSNGEPVRRWLTRRLEIIGISPQPMEEIVPDTPCRNPLLDPTNICYIVEGRLTMFLDSPENGEAETARAAIRASMNNGDFASLSPEMVRVSFVDLTFQQPPPPTGSPITPRIASNKGLPLWAIVLIAVGGVLLLGLIAYICRRRRERLMIDDSDDRDMESDSAYKDYEPPPAQEVKKLSPHPEDSESESESESSSESSR